MKTTCTAILSIEAPAAAEEFERWVHDEPVILLVVLGDGDDVQRTVERADKIAASLLNEFPTLPHVLWARNRVAIESVIDSLEGSPALKAKLKDCKAFALNLTDKLVDVIDSDEPVSLIRLFKAFNKALEKAVT